MFSVILYSIIAVVLTVGIIKFYMTKLPFEEYPAPIEWLIILGTISFVLVFTLGISSSVYFAATGHLVAWQF